jgi:hypothetical protein
MSLSLQIGYQDINKSITNPNVNKTNALDVETPFSFLEFIKILTDSYEPESLQEYYTIYLRKWNTLNVGKYVNENDIIVKKYKEFISEININYTTLEEKEFLSKVDFNDPYDLDVILGFYSKKLKDLSLFYNRKRDNVKYNVLRNKLKGTNFGISKTLSELTISYLESIPDGSILFDIDNIKRNIDIEIEELYDTYPLYFNQPPDERIYDNKDIDYGYDIFLKSNQELIGEIFSGLSDELKTIKEVDNLLNNKRKLTEKYLFTDFYYLSTGSTVTDFVSGKLLESSNTVSNFVNRDYPTTASTQRTEYLESIRYRGFFKPSNISIVLVDGLNSSFSFNFSNLEPNKIYYFPDPKILGKNGDVINFIVDDSFIKKNYSSGKAVNQPTSTNLDTKYYGYVSQIEPSEYKYLDKIFDYGFITEVKTDFYNNLYGLFNNGNRFTQNITTITSEPIYYNIIDGYKFFDDWYWEYYEFNYSTVDSITLENVIRTGFDGQNFGNFLDNDQADIILSFGVFSNLYNMPDEDPEKVLLEGALLADSKNQPLIDLQSSDLLNFETFTDSFYYSLLVEGAIHSNDPLQRALLDPLYPSISANFIDVSLTPTISVVDGGSLGIQYDFNIPNEYDNVTFVPISDNPTVFSLVENLPTDSYSLSGKLFVKNSITKEIKPIVESLEYLTSKYSGEVLHQLSSMVQRFETINDVILIETSNYFSINKIEMNSKGFIDPKTANYTIDHSTNNFDKLSNRFKIKNKIYYVKLNTKEDLENESFIVYPEVFEYNLLENKNIKLFPLRESDIESFPNILDYDVRYTECQEPTLTYNSRNNLFNVSYLLKDQNNFPRLESCDFYLNPNLIFKEYKTILFSNNSISNIFNSLENLRIELDSNNIQLVAEEFII